MYISNSSVKATKVAEGIDRKILAAAGSLMAVEFKLRKGVQIAVHHHPHEQVSYIVSGSVAFQIDNKTETLRAGDSCYIAPGTPHGVEALSDTVALDVFTPQRQDFLR